MKKINIIILFVFLSFSVSAENNNLVTKDDWRAENNNIKNSIVSLNEKITTIDDITSTSTASVANQLAAASTNMTIFGLLFGIFVAVGAIFLSLYVNRIEQKIKSLLSENKKILNDSKIIQDDLHRINYLIQHDINGLYEKLKNEEINYVIERLVTVPEDILNLHSFLASRTIPEHLYNKLKLAFMSRDLSDTNADLVMKNFIIIFYQHYPSKIFLDGDLYLYIKPHLRTCMSCCFKSELITTTKLMLNDLVYHSRFFEFLFDLLSASLILSAEYQELVIQTIKDTSDSFHEDIKNKISETINSVCQH